MFRSRRKRQTERRLFDTESERKKQAASGSAPKKRNLEAEHSLFLRRMIVCISIGVLMICTLFINLYYLQIISYDEYRTRSNENRIKVLPVVPPRGIIYDRNHVVLADNRPVYHMVLYPAKGINTRDTITELNSLLKLRLSDKDVQNLSHQSRTRQRFTGIELSDLLTEEQIATFAVHSYRFPNVQIEVNLKRFYPFADIATHALGYVSRINRQDVERLTADQKIENYEGSTEIGKLGVERYYEDVLHGSTGTREVEVNSHGQIVRTLRYNPPTPGSDLTLSIDIRLQYYAQELLNNMRGAVVAIEPSSGEILAMYSSPSYDPNLFVRGIRTNEYKRLLDNTGRPLINRVTQGGYAPASTVKPLLCMMGLNEHLVTPLGTFFGHPAFRLPNSTHQFRDWRSWGHGWMDLYRAIEISADTFFYDLAYRAGINTIHDYLDRFGFGRSTGVDISEESLGINPSREWKRARFRQPWHLGDTVPIGIGQGYWTTTLLQLTKAHTTLANRGEEVTPHLMRSITSPTDNHIVSVFDGKSDTDNLNISDSSYWDVCRAGMYLVVNGPEGTGRRAFYGTQYKAAGKSGTAQVVSIKQGEKYNARALKVEHRDNALFVAFAPFVHPRILVGVILENEGGGSAKAAPIARKIIDKYLLDLYPGGYMGESVPEQKRFGMGGTVMVQ